MSDTTRLVPVLREGVHIIKMVFFKRLKEHLSESGVGKDATDTARLAGAVVNQVFGTPNPQEPHRSFAEANAQRIQSIIDRIAVDLEDMRIPLTDALRVQFLCDRQEGIDSEETLAAAKDHGILLVDREVPLPAAFMNLARRLGAAFQLLQNLPQPEPPETK
ncbi:hypothetical protein SAMN02746041_01870 [Desulfacinum hydrothermale DSM 13146]|uniref:Uncharacterized protein n=1 Tax=Desulfacinum hydrothermale DSM 13146 TaxID=1121390 RepID=A0A1W1XIZ6_9BACT|nr:hypothetical protein [Desulfacinum hydrothermale]SMC23929.1 hypothetical protein SAMN02746041_01870 [Desulfacinum hydrothermale DSM 13146]